MSKIAEKNGICYTLNKFVVVEQLGRLKHMNSAGS